MHRDVRNAIVRREAGRTRARLATLLGTIAALVLTAVFTTVAAGSTHAKKTIAHVVRIRRRPTHVVAPAPPLVAVQSSAPAQSAPPPAPAPTPAPVQAAPVVVSGGS